jgi:hypothetical protein
MTRAAVAAVVSLLAGCAPVTSERWSNGPAPDGIVYFLPLQQIKVTVTVPDGKDGAKNNYDVSVEPGPAYPDPTQRYVLKLRGSPLATRKHTVSTDERGLLTSVSPVITSQVTAALQKIGAAAATASTRFADQKQCAPGPQHLLLDPKEVAGKSHCERLCQLCIKIERVPSKPSNSEDSSKSKATDDPLLKNADGIFYRRQLPYKVTVTGNVQTQNQTQTITREFLVFSASESPTYFQPFSKSLLTDTAAIATLESPGMLTKFEETDNSEALALLTLPADILGAYFGAIGKMFDWQKTALDQEKTYLDTLNQLSVAKLQSENCKNAISTATVVTPEIKAACGLQ